jgi:hypothetical protein
VQVVRFDDLDDHRGRECLQDLLLIGGKYIPWRPECRGPGDGIVVGARVFVSERAIVEIRGLELPELVWIVEPREAGTWTS